LILQPRDAAAAVDDQDPVDDDAGVDGRFCFGRLKPPPRGASVLEEIEGEATFSTGPSRGWTVQASTLWRAEASIVQAAAAAPDFLSKDGT
jgi:hypothetical protein